MATTAKVKQTREIGQRVSLNLLRAGDTFAVPTDNDAPDGIGLYRVEGHGKTPALGGEKSITRCVRLDATHGAQYAVNFESPTRQTVLVVGLAATTT